MALRDQPYLPLYIQDFLTDEKLNECSAESTGVYIRLLCLMHKSKEYGTILLQQKDKQTSQHIENFALKLIKHMPYSSEVIHRSLHELINEDVIQINGNRLSQKRMIKDNNISIIRADAGKKGGFATAKHSAKEVANSENETENENETIIKDKRFIIPSIDEVRAYCKERGNKVDPGSFINFYESKGWMIGKNKMKDWKAAIRTWESKERSFNNTVIKPQTVSIKQPEYKGFGKPDPDQQDEVSKLISETVKKMVK